MTLTITNGTLSSTKETIVPAAGYMRPSSVTVSGGTDSYTRSTGLLEISNPTDVTVAASALKSTAEIDVDELDLAPGTYQITVKAVGAGYADSDASNVVTYIIPENALYDVNDSLLLDANGSVLESNATD